MTGRLHEIDDMFSPWRRDSWVSRLISGELVPEDCPLEVQRVVELSVQMMELTDGFFSPYWRRRPYGDPGPDPTGLVKGWAAQQASDLLVAQGLPDHAVNAAGDVVVSGRSAPGDPDSAWHIGISDPHHDRRLAGVLDLDQGAARWAVATSGTAELGAHVGDPHTGRFPRSVASATAVTRIEECEGVPLWRTPVPPLWSRREKERGSCRRDCRGTEWRSFSSSATGPCTTREGCSHRRRRL